MPVGKAFTAFLADQFAGFDGISMRPMFGGLSVFSHGVVFAMAVDDVLYLRATQEADRAAFAAEGSGPFRYDGKAKTVEMPYWQVPARLYDDADEFRVWAQRAMASAVREKSGPKKKPAKRPAADKPAIEKPARKPAVKKAT